MCSYKGGILHPWLRPQQNHFQHPSLGTLDSHTLDFLDPCGVLCSTTPYHVPRTPSSAQWKS